MNCWNVRAATKVQDMFTFTKVLARIMVVVAGAVWLALGRTDNLFSVDPMKNTAWSPGHIALSFYSGLFSYAGWNYLNFVTEELKEPNKNLPR